MGTQEQRLKQPPRVVLDTNTLVSTLIFGGGKLKWLRRAWQGSSIVPLVSHVTAGELIRVLTYPKFGLDGDQQETLLAEFLPYAEIVAVGKVVRGLPKLRDTDDLAFLALAKVGKAAAVLTGDNDLLVVRKDWTDVPIMTPAEFLEGLGSRGQ